VRWLGTFTYKLWCMTYRRRVEGFEKIRRYVRPGLPSIGICWHQRLFYVPYWSRGFPGIVYIVSQSKDGEMIASVLEGLGFATVRGSSSRRAGRAAVELREHLQKGFMAGITPDGPKGPGRKVQPGVVRLAVETGAAVLPMAVSARSAWWTRGWDRFLFPKPGTEVLILLGDPLLPPPPDCTEEDKESFRSRIGHVLDEVTRQADRRFGWDRRHPRASQGIPEKK
jgi:lysophospholipid acyltransferase (LPLAT)-like uncharacterized protein